MAIHTHTWFGKCVYIIWWLKSYHKIVKKDISCLWCGNIQNAWDTIDICIHWCHINSAVCMSQKSTVICLFHMHVHATVKTFWSLGCSRWGDKPWNSSCSPGAVGTHLSILPFMNPYNDSPYFKWNSIFLQCQFSECESESGSVQCGSVGDRCIQLSVFNSPQSLWCWWSQRHCLWFVFIQLFT